jgi:hypothetical protein
MFRFSPKKKEKMFLLPTCIKQAQAAAQKNKRIQFVKNKMGGLILVAFIIK